MDQFMNCTPDNPMPENRDQMGQQWYHHGAKIFTHNTMKCPNCGYEFAFTRTRLGKLSDPEVIKKIQKNSKDLRDRGVIFTKDK